MSPDISVVPGGVIPSQSLGRLAKAGIIETCAENSVSLQPASCDLTVGNRAYRLQSSFLPQNTTVREGMKDLEMYNIDLSNGAILEKGAVYLIPLKEKLRLDDSMMGKTNPKSSTGRLDVFTRVITDYCTRFEEIKPSYTGELFLEVVPRSFTIKIREGDRLNQLRLFAMTSAQENESPLTGWEKELSSRLIYLKESRLKKAFYDFGLLYDSEGQIKDHERHMSHDGILMSIELSPSKSSGRKIIGYKSKKNSQVLDLANIGKYRAEDFWEPLYPPQNGRLIIEPEEFYIFASKEAIRIPLDFAAEMVEFDAGSGELRTHYAGFFDPGFGYGKEGEIKGTKAVLEVRPHDVPFVIEDGQILFKMKYEPMLEKPDIVYGADIGSNYHDQTLKLSKLFI